MQNHVTLLTEITQTEYENLITHFNGYGIVKKLQSELTLKRYELDSSFRDLDQKHNPKHAAVLSLQNQALVAFSQFESLPSPKTNYMWGDDQFARIILQSKILGLQQFVSSQKVDVEVYNWKKTFTFKLYHLQNRHLLSISDFNTSTTISERRNDRQRMYHKIPEINQSEVQARLEKVFDGVMSLFELDRREQRIKEHANFIEQLTKSDGFAEDGYYRFWMIEFVRVLSFLLEDKQ